MTSVMSQIKEELKQLAKDLRIQKGLFKSKQREEGCSYRDFANLSASKVNARYSHIAICLVRGTPYERIEPKVKPGNEPDMESVENYKEDFLARLAEVTHE